MKSLNRILRASLLVALVAGAGGLFAGVATQNVQAQSVFVSDDSITQSKAVQGSFFGAGSTVQITEDIDGDVFVAGQTITITGKVAGDVVVAGQTVVISGTVEGDVHALAQTVTIAGTVDGSVSGGIQTLIVGGDGSVGRDLNFIGQAATIDGTVQRDINAVVERLAITGSVARNVSYMSNVDLSRASSAEIGGTVVRNDAPRTEAPAQTFGQRLAYTLYWAAAALFGVLLVSLIFPRWIRSASNATQPTPWKALLVGLITAFVAPALIIFLAITIIGLPAAFVALLAAIIVSALGFVFASHYIGRLIFRDSGVVLQSATGAILYIVLRSIPIIGFFVWVIGSLIGTGTIVLDAARRVSTSRAATPEKKVVSKK